MLTIPASHLVAFSLAGDPPLHLSVLEVSDRDWWAQQSKMEGSNPFGAKLWPAALGVAEHLSNLPAIGWESVGSALDCCCGNGLVAITLAARGVPTVIASDISPLALEMTAQAAAAQQLTAVSTLTSARKPHCRTRTCAYLPTSSTRKSSVASWLSASLRQPSAAPGWSWAAMCAQGGAPSSSDWASYFLEHPGSSRSGTMTSSL